MESGWSSGMVAGYCSRTKPPVIRQDRQFSYSQSIGVKHGAAGKTLRCGAYFQLDRTAATVSPAGARQRRRRFRPIHVRTTTPYSETLVSSKTVGTQRRSRRIQSSYRRQAFRFAARPFQRCCRCRSSSIQNSGGRGTFCSNAEGRTGFSRFPIQIPRRRKTNLSRQHRTTRLCPIRRSRTVARKQFISTALGHERRGAAPLRLISIVVQNSCASLSLSLISLSPTIITGWATPSL